MAEALAFAIISMVISAAISFAFPAEGPRLKDLSVSTSTYGTAIPEVWGTVRVGANMIWSNPIKEHRKKQKAGIGSFYNQYTYTCDFAMALCKGPAQSLRRVWANGKLIFDATGASTTVDNGKFIYTFYTGAEDQMPDPVIQAGVGAVNAPAYRGMCYVLFHSFLLTDYGNQIPQIACEVYAGPDQGSPTTLITADGVALSAYENQIYAADFDRGYLYFTNSTAHSVLRVRLSDGVQDMEVAPFLEPEDKWDDGKLNRVLGVGEDGNPICIFGGSNLMRMAQLDPYSLQPGTRIGHTQPGVGYVDFAPPYIPFSPNVVFNDDRTFFITISLQKDIWVFPEYLDPNPILTKPLGRYGNLYSSFAACGGGSTGWYFLTSTGYWGFDNTLVLHALDTDQQGVYTHPNPDAALGSTYMDQLSVVHDTNSNAAIMFYRCAGTQNCYATKYAFDTDTLVWTTLLPHPPSANYRAQNIQTNQIAWAADTKLWILDTSDGTFVNRGPDSLFYTKDSWLSIADLNYTNPGNAGYTLPYSTGADNQVYDGKTGNLVVLGSGHPTIIRTGQFGNESVTLYDIVASLMDNTGLDPDQLDLSMLGSIPVRGYGFAQSNDIKNIVAELKQIYMFDLIEQDGQIVGVVRGDTEASAEIISYKALASQSGDSADKAGYWTETRTSEADLPASLSLSYFNSDLDFETNTAVSRRIFAPIPTMFSRQTDGVEASIVLTATEAKNLVNAMLYIQWSERTKHQTKLPLSYGYLEPTDMITVVMEDDRSYYERIERQEMGADYSINTDTRGQDSGAYLFDLTGDGGNGMTQTLHTPQPAKAFIFNTPYLRDADAGGDGSFSIYYMGLGNLGADAFNGGTIFGAPDAQNYNILDILTNDVEWGTVQPPPLPPPSHGCFALDWVNTITVFPANTNFELESITDDELWAGANICVVGNEVIQFRDAIQNVNGSWTISNLLRGRRGTEWASDNHASGESFVFLNVTTIDIGQEPLDATGKDFWFKGVGSGRDLSITPAIEIDYAPRDLMPYAPADIRRSIDIGTGDITVTWSRRTRLGGNMADGTGVVPLAETSESYEIYILSGSFDADNSRSELPSNILRSYTAATPTIDYSAADQATDAFTSATDTLHVVIYQISGAIGRGFPGIRDIEPAAFF